MWRFSVVRMKSLKPIPISVQVFRNIPLIRSAYSSGVVLLARRGLVYLVAVLVGAGEEIRIVAEERMEPAHVIGEYGGVRVPDVRLRVHVVDRRGDVEFFFHGVPLFALTPRPPLPSRVEKRRGGVFQARYRGNPLLIRVWRNGRACAAARVRRLQSIRILFRDIFLDGLDPGDDLGLQ